MKKATEPTEETTETITKSAGTFDLIWQWVDPSKSYTVPVKVFSSNVIGYLLTDVVP